MMRKLLTGVAIASLCLAAPAGATENGQQHFPIGVNTIAAGIAPLPGTIELQNYTQFAWSNQLIGNNGVGGSKDFDLNLQIDAPRFLYTSPWSLGPFHYTGGLITPIAHGTLNAFGSSDEKTSFGDVDIENYLSYASPNHKLFTYFGLETWIPVGAYNRSALLNIGLNYWSFQPSINLTWIPTQKWEVSGTAVAGFNTTNRVTNYHSGADFDLDWGVSYRPFASAPNFGIGPAGYFYQQIQDDTVGGQKVEPDGNRGREFGIGGQVRWDIGFGGIALKYQRSYAVVNRPEFNRIWLEFAMPLK